MHGIKPHRFEGYLASNDQDFESKAADVIGLYLKPPQDAAVSCVDEETALQALGRKGPVLRPLPGRAHRHGLDCWPHGTLSLNAVFNILIGEVPGRTAARHTSAEFVAFFPDIATCRPIDTEVHVTAPSGSRAGVACTDVNSGSVFFDTVAEGFPNSWRLRRSADT